MRGVNSINKRIQKILLIFCCTILFTICFSANSYTYAANIGSGSFQIDFIDVGQGDAELVQCDGHYMLVDGGDSSRSGQIYSYLKNRSISYLDVLVSTHPHPDHIGGLSGALNYANTGRAYSPVTSLDTKEFQSFVQCLGNQGKTITVPNPGDVFMLGSAKVTVLGPRVITSSPNDNSIVLRIEYGNTSFLLAGDAEAAEENSILNSGQMLHSTVLKVGHHGSDTSTGYRFLKEVSPQYAVISVGKGNQYGFPDKTVLNRLRDADVITYRTDLQGDIICISDGNSVTFSVK